MNFTLIIQYVTVVLREIWLHKFLCLFGFALVSFFILGVGVFWPSKFETSATIYADNQNILKPLLQKQAAQSSVQDQTKVVRDMMHSPRMLNKVIEQVFDVDSFESAEEKEAFVNNLRGKIKVKPLGAGYIKISYSDKTSGNTYAVINSVVDVFIKASAEEQKIESRDAFLFIDNQVKQYKDQLVLAEERLKEFHSFNLDGRDADVDASISRLRGQIEDLKISLDEDRTMIGSLKKQLDDESEYSGKKFKADVYTDRLEKLENNKSALLMNYTEDYPDVVSLTYQIEDIKNAIRESAEEKKEQSGEQAGSSGSEENILNPLYQELRSRLSQVQRDLKAKEKRLNALEDLKTKEFKRRKRIAERGAEKAELTRDYTVTKRIYEDMLERKEKARLSMTLNVEGQGVTYRIQEPALPPLNPIGLRFLHFVLLGPFLGVFAVIGLVVVYVLLDQRIRFPDTLLGLGVPTLAVIPHVKTPFTKRVVRMDMLICLSLGILIMSAYIGLAYASKMGFI